MFQELGVVAAPFGTAEPATLTIYNQPSTAPAIPSKLGSPPSLAPPSAISLASQVPLNVKPVGIAPHDPSPRKNVVALPPVGTKPTLVVPA